MRDLVYHTQMGRLAIDASEQRRRENEARALALEAMPRVIYRAREIAVAAEDNDQALRAAKFLADVALPRLEAVTHSAPDGGAIQVQHDHSSLLAKLLARRDELMGRTADALPALPTGTVDRIP